LQRLAPLGWQTMAYRTEAHLSPSDRSASVVRYMPSSRRRVGMIIAYWPLVLIEDLREAFAKARATWPDSM